MSVVSSVFSWGPGGPPNHAPEVVFSIVRDPPAPRCQEAAEDRRPSDSDAVGLEADRRGSDGERASAPSAGPSPPLLVLPPSAGSGGTRGYQLPKCIGPDRVGLGIPGRSWPPTGSTSPLGDCRAPKGMPCTRCAHKDRPYLAREARAGRGGALQTNHRLTPWRAVRARGAQKRSLIERRAREFYFPGMHKRASYVILLFHCTCECHGTRTHPYAYRR